MKQQNVDVDVSGLYYITHIDNLMSIINRGIFSHGKIYRERIPYTPIYDQSIVVTRATRAAIPGKSLWNYANLFFYPRNSMLYRVLIEQSAENIVVIVVNPAILDRKGIRITTGNAWSWQSQILPRNQGLLKIREFQKMFELESRSYGNGSKPEFMAECLVPKSVPPEYIQGAYVVDNQVVDAIRIRHPNIKVDVISKPYLFFRPLSGNPFINKSILIKGNTSPVKIWKQGEINFAGKTNHGPSVKARYHVLGTGLKDQNSWDRTAR